MLRGDAHQVWVFRTPSEKWKPECIVPKEKAKGFSMMVWGCFGGGDHGAFCLFVVKSANARLYLKFLEYLVRRSCNSLTTTLATLYFSRIILQCMLHQFVTE